MKRWIIGSFALLPFIVAVSPNEAPAAPVPPACHPLSTALEPIAGMQTGQVVEDGNSTTLRFSSGVRDCGPWPNEFQSSDDDCTSRWSFQIHLPSGHLTLGDHYLANEGATFSDAIETKTIRSGCTDKCSTSVNMIGELGITSGVAKLVIESIDDVCITGTVVGIGDPTSADAPNFNGAFFAVRCAP